jgi:DNA-binding response OmpR family regulator
MGILIVDDNEDTLEIFEAILAKDGHRTVTTADTAAKALSLLQLEPASALNQAVPFELIFLDIVMPDMDGIDICARIRQDARYHSVPVVMTTALDDIDTIDKALKRGATDYLTKPLKAIDLLACVRSKLKLKGELDRRDVFEHQLGLHRAFQFEMHETF